MKKLKKLSWQIPFLLFLILGTYYALTQNSKRSYQWKETGSIHGISYSITCQGNTSQQKALSAELESIRLGMERAIQADSLNEAHPDTISARIYRMLVQFLNKEQLTDFHIEVNPGQPLQTR